MNLKMSLPFTIFASIVAIVLGFLVYLNKLPPTTLLAYATGVLIPVTKELEKTEEKTNDKSNSNPDDTLKP